MVRLASITCFAAVLVVILFAGLRSEPVPQVFNHQDWLHHAAAFAALVCSARLAFPRVQAFWMVLYCLMLALLIELGQGLLPMRTASVGDMVANITGVLIGLMVAGGINRQIATRRVADEA
ncbi:VanZ family protein [Pseudomonas sp. PDM14]|nr:VanZ family protein [Pseudomonas sp. PDM14]